MQGKDGYFIEDALVLVDAMNDNIMQISQVPRFEEIDLVGDASFHLDIHKKFLKEASSLSETVVRWFKEKSGLENKALQVYNDEISLNLISCQLIRWMAELVKIGSVDHSKIILILDLVFELGDDVAEAFNDSFKDISPWIFLKWLPQLMSYMNTPNYKFFLPLIERLIQAYPEPCFYAISVTIDELVWKEDDKLGDGLRCLR